MVLSTTSVLTPPTHATALVQRDHHSDRDFLSDAANGDIQEIVLGTFAMQRGNDPMVRMFGQILATDHQMLLQQVLQLAQAEGVKLKLKFDSRELNRLAQLQGRAFDAEFVNYMVQDHINDINNYENEVLHGRDTYTRILANMQIPTLQKHLNIALTLKQQLGV